MKKALTQCKHTHLPKYLTGAFCVTRDDVEDLNILTSELLCTKCGGHTQGSQPIWPRQSLCNRADKWTAVGLACLQCKLFVSVGRILTCIGPSTKMHFQSCTSSGRFCASACLMINELDEVKNKTQTRDLQQTSANTKEPTKGFHPFTPWRNLHLRAPTCCAHCRAGSALHAVSQAVDNTACEKPGVNGAHKNNGWVSKIYKHPQIICSLNSLKRYPQYSQHHVSIVADLHLDRNYDDISLE